MEEDKLSDFVATTSAEDDFKPSPGQLTGFRKRITELFQRMQQKLTPDLLDELKIACGELLLAQSPEQTVLGKKSLNEIFGLLLKHYNNDVRRSFLEIANRILEIVKDFPCRKELEELCVVIKKENEVFKLEKGSLLHGRDREMKTLSDYTDFEAKRVKGVRVINVCGMTGIGKSCLVKHFGCRLLKRGDIEVIYVDLSEVQRIEELEFKMLRSINESASEANDVLGTFTSYLQKDSTAKYVLILDDLTLLMPDTDQGQIHKMLSWIQMLTRRMEELKINLKLVVTSQKTFVTAKEKDQSAKLASSVKVMKDYTKDMMLNPLKEEDALKFLASTPHPINHEDKVSLVGKCHGHPHLLHTLEMIASQEYTLTTETDVHVDAHASTMEAANGLFPKLFNRLDERQALILFVVAMFDGIAELKALHYIVNPEGVSEETFISQVKEQFSNSFWLTFQSDRDEDKQRKFLARLHHPLIKRFIGERIVKEVQLGSDQSKEFMKMKKRFTTYNVGKMIRIGRLCVSNKHLSQVNSIFMDGQANFRKAMVFSMEAEDPSLLFADGSRRRGCSEIAHLFLFFHLYHDWFKGFLSKAMLTLVNISVGDVYLKVLLRSLFLMVLAVQQDWRRLDDVLKSELEGSEPACLEQVDEELSLLCQAINGFAAGSLYTHAPFYKERTDPQLVDRRNQVLTDAGNRLKVQSGSSLWDGVKNYFSVHCLLLLAKAKWLTNRRDIPTIRNAAKFCEQAKDLINRDSLLMPVVLTELAEYRGIEGTLCTQVEPAAKMYEQAQTLHEDVIRLFNEKSMERTSAAARNINAYAVLMRNYANLLTEHRPVPDNYRAKALECLRMAVTNVGKAIKIFKDLSVHSKQELFKCYFDMADSCERLQYETPHSAPDVRLNCQDEALANYREAFLMIKNDRRSCNLSPNDHNLKRLMKRLPELMKMHGESREAIEKVSFTLKKVQEDAIKEEKAKSGLAMSDYDGSSSSEGLSDDETDMSGGPSSESTWLFQQDDTKTELDDTADGGPSTSGLTGPFQQGGR